LVVAKIQGGERKQQGININLYSEKHSRFPWSSTARRSEIWAAVNLEMPTAFPVNRHQSSVGVIKLGENR
jgi:hypothetical protein